jgi:hypothetical protein
MKSFKQFINEKRLYTNRTEFVRLVGTSQWKLILDQKAISIRKSLVSKVFNNDVIVTGAHITEPTEEMYNRLSSIQGKNSSISTTLTVHGNTIERGIATKGGAVYIVSGTPLIVSPEDAYTVMDKQGNRWIARNTIFALALKKKLNIEKIDYTLEVLGPTLVETIKRYPELGELIRENLDNFNGKSESEINILAMKLSNLLYEAPRSNVGYGIDLQKVKYSLIKSYFFYVEKHIKKHMQFYQDLFSIKNIKDVKTDDKSFDREAPNEIVLSNIKIEYILIYDNIGDKNTMDSDTWEVDGEDLQNIILGKTPWDEITNALEDDNMRYDFYDDLDEMEKMANDMIKDSNKNVTN